ncbi:MAG: hypothetical protein H2057_00905 [Alphaproteobacteria bacterium]|nr:hypothetical protein [Alphaproteobacteria bacterium]
MLKKQIVESHLMELLDVNGYQKPTLFGVRVDPTGHLLFDQNPHIPETCFSYKGVPFTMCFYQEGAQWKMSVYGFLGAIPFTCESPKQRAFILTVLCALRAHKGLKAKPEVTVDQHLMVVSHTVTDTLSTGIVFGALTSVLWELEPYLQLVSEHAASFKNPMLNT